MSLEERLACLEAVRDIGALKARYAALADAKYLATHQRVAPAEWRRIAEQQAGCFTEDATWDGTADFGGALQGRREIAAWFTRSPWRFALHFYMSPQITLESPASAKAIWRLWQIAIRDGEDKPVLLAATTEEAYRWEQNGWLITHMRFTQIHQAELPTTLASK